MQRTDARAIHDEETERLRIPPQSIEAEQGVLGGLLFDNGTWDLAADTLVASDFYRLEHRWIFDAIGRLIGASRPADVVTVHVQLQAMDTGGADVGLKYLNELAQSVPSAGNVRRYAEIVRERAVLRKLIVAGDEIVASAFNPQGRVVSEILDAAESKVMSIGEESSRGGQGFRMMDTLAIQLIDEVTALAESGAGDVTGVRTGYFDLDQSTAGLQAGDLIILAARPSMGKTALAMNIAENVAITNGQPVLVFSMEMSAEQLTKRMAGSQGKIDQQHLRTGKLDGDEWGRLTEAIERLSKSTICIDDTPNLSVAELRARSRRQARIVGKLGLIVVDYLQLMGGSSDMEGENRATAVGAMSRGLKALAREMNCPVIALSQLNRAVESRTDKRPLMSDLRESGSIEQDADIVAFIYRDDYYDKNSKEPGVAEVILAKHRSGPVGTIKLAFLKQWTKFENLAPDYSRGDAY
jgi:replicative DNA helicase